MSSDVLKFIPIILLTGILAGCYSRTEGCLDSFAANFDVSSDDACSTCCVYPSLILSIQNRYGDSAFHQNDTLINRFGQKYIILGMRYYMSDFSLYQNNNDLTVREVIQNKLTGEIIPDEIKIAKSDESGIKCGTVRTYGSFDSIRFVMGIDGKFLEEGLTTLPAGHVLEKQNRINDAQGNMAAAGIRCKVLTPVDTIINIFISTDFKLQYTIRDSISETRQGQPITGKIIADYQQLLDDVDLLAPYIEIRNKVTENCRRFLIVR